ncbi:hypothetical protein LOTGIDRAFT_228434 [Lottia gigantea]|uniref:Uncharacterized protein n=1 Tax=Lottia gigantea TaxID=225164 RepID=V4A258_LOTGI|nr:hypothetical protein LOTGIDRAFT_228434 [Lottia gigantea]ESO97918.1 hypothetical protein LOTGIDRAFT_228434 [Lottia gigantea]
MDEEEAELKTTEGAVSVAKDKEKPTGDTSSELSPKNSPRINGSEEDKERGIPDDNASVNKNFDTTDMSQNQDKDYGAVPLIEDPKYKSVVLNQNLQNGDKEETESEESTILQDPDGITDKEKDTNPDISKDMSGEANNLVENVPLEETEKIEDVSVSMPQLNSPAISPRSPIRSNDEDSGTKAGDNGPAIDENLANIDDRVYQKEEDTFQDEHQPGESPRDTSVNSPRTPLSGVASDQGGSFDAYSDEEDNSLIAQQLVNQVIDKAVDTVNDPDGTAAYDLDKSGENHHNGSVEGQYRPADDFGLDNQIDGGNNDISVTGKTTDPGDDPFNDELTNIFLQRGRGNGEESDGDDSQQQVVQPDDADGSRISVPAQQDDDNDTHQHLNKNPTNQFEDVSDIESFQQEATGNNENIPEETGRTEPSAQGETQTNGMFSSPEDGALLTEEDDMKDSQITDVLGVKECLIFETGEINKENKKSRIRSDSSSTASPVKPDSDPRIPNSPQGQEDKKVFKINKAALNDGGISIHPDGLNEMVHIASEQTGTEIRNPSDTPEHDEELVSDSQMLTHETFSPSPKAARHAPSFNIDNYNHIRKDLFTRRSGDEDQEEDYIPEQENKENIPESRSKKKSRNSPLGRPPAGRVVHQEDGSRYSPNVVSSPPSSGPIPGFNTMQEQQVNWLRMFKVLEDQHRTELKAQYAKHSQMIEQMQNTMETELKKQQNNIQRRLEAHRDALTETAQDESSSLSVYGYYTNDPGNLRRSPNRRSPRSGSDVYLSAARSPRADSYHSDSSDIDPLEIRRRMYTTGSSRAPAGIPGLADISDYSTLPSDSFHVKKTLDAEYDSTQTSILLSEAQRSPRSLLERPRSADGGERLLRGGVYSTPMPMSKGRSPQTVYDSGVLNDTIYRTGSGTKPSKTTELQYQGHGDIGTDVNEESLYSSNVKLREKHAKHVADLKAYYEEEIQALRSALSSSHSNKETPNERILKEDNQDLRRRCEDLTDELDDANNCIRDLEQKIQGLEIRANDYSDRYKDSQVTVLTLKTRLEELHSYAKERDHMLDSLEQKVKHQAIALQDSYKIQDELQQTSKHDQMALQRTLCKYEDLDKEYRLLKESFISKERSLYDARAEISDLNKTVSRLELKNKQLMRENDNLLHKSAIAMNMSSAKTNYEESYSLPEQSSEQFTSYMSNHYDKNTGPKRHDNYQDSSHYNEYNLKVDLPDKPKNTRVSPLIKAEQELIKLQTNTNLSDNLDFKTQKKFYGSDNNYPPCNRDIASGSRIDIKAPGKNGDMSPGTRATWNKGQPKRSNLKAPVKDMSTPSRFDVSVKEVGGNGKEKKKVVQIQEKNRTRSPRNGSNSPAPVRTVGDEVSRKLNGVDETLDKIRQGEVINNWKGDNSSQISSTSFSTKTESVPVQAMTREERIKERLQMIQQQEKRYDELTIEKRQLESALNRIPIHGRVGRKSITEKDDLEKKLEKVEHELGSVRMSLRKYQVLKSSR